MAKKTLNVMICGSEKFDDERFVFGTLESLWMHTNKNLNSVFTTKFSGACQFAVSWIEQKNLELQDSDKISIKNYSFDKHLDKRNNSFFENIDLPDFILENDEYFIKGKEMCQSENIGLLLAFPNADGKLGAATKNMIRFAERAGVKILDCSNLLEKIQEQRAKNTQVDKNDVENKGEETGFVNQHSTRKIK